MPDSKLTRGSKSSLSPVHIQAISEPRRSSRGSLSAFQTPARGSDVLLTDPEPAPSNRPYLIAVILLLLATVGVLILLLLI